MDHRCVVAVVVDFIAATWVVTSLVGQSAVHSALRDHSCGNEGNKDILVTQEY